MSDQHYETCMTACEKSAQACDEFLNVWLQRLDFSAVERSLRLGQDCASISRIAAGFMALNSEFASAMCQLCADVCDAFVEECEKNSRLSGERCISACRKCAAECRRMLLSLRPLQTANPLHVH